MKGLVLETNRTLIAMRFSTLIYKSIKEKFGKGKESQQWADKGHLGFLRMCDVTPQAADIDPEIQVEGSELSQILDRWMRADKFRDSPDGEWKPIPQEAQNIIVTFINELREHVKNNH